MPVIGLSPPDTLKAIQIIRDTLQGAWVRDSVTKWGEGGLK